MDAIDTFAMPPKTPLDKAGTTSACLIYTSLKKWKQSCNNKEPDLCHLDKLLKSAKAFWLSLPFKGSG